MQKPKKHQEVFDNSFYKLIEEINRTLAANEDGTDQRQQVEALLAAEIEFKEIILKYRQSTEIYKRFIQRVRITNKNILSARPYFRETATTFSKKITPAIKEENIEKLKTFNINYQFIKFTRDNWLGPFPKKATKLFNNVHVARETLIENNMPLALNRAKLFYRKTPKSHLTLMDLIGICATGLTSGIDKWCGKYSPVFRSVCIGRMVGNMIDAYSETMLHFYPSDRRFLYKANAIRGRQGIDEVKELTKAVNNAFIEDAKLGKSMPKSQITVSQLHDLMNAASAVSADATTNEEGYGVYHYTEDTEKDIETVMIEREMTAKMLSLSKNLPTLQKKILRLKGIKV